MFVAPRLDRIEPRPYRIIIFSYDPLRFLAYCSRKPYMPPRHSRMLFWKGSRVKTVLYQLTYNMWIMHPGWKGIIFRMYLVPKFRSPTVVSATHTPSHVPAVQSLIYLLQCLLVALLHFSRRSSIWTIQYPSHRSMWRHHLQSAPSSYCCSIYQSVQ